jgi:hypothetical protein
MHRRVKLDLLARPHEAETAAPPPQFQLVAGVISLYVIQFYARLFMSNEETSSIVGEGTSTAVSERICSEEANCRRVQAGTTGLMKRNGPVVGQAVKPQVYGCKGQYILH